MSQGLQIRVLGELAVERDGRAEALPASRKTRALLGFLILNARPQRRDSLCELLWDLPDDPRAALRWSLSKLRPIVNDNDHERLIADRERVELRPSHADVDLIRAERTIADERASIEALRAALKTLKAPLLEGSDEPENERFQAWLVAARSDVERLRAEAARRLATHPDARPDEAVIFAEAWLEASPFNADAATFLVAALKRTGDKAKAELTEKSLFSRFAEAGIALSPAPEKIAHEAAPQQRDRALLNAQRIQFCKAADGATIAYATVGAGPPIVKAANWLNHLEYDWDAPIWSPLFRELARDHFFLRYDERGNGLSDWDVADISFEAFVTDLETVVDAAGLERFPLLGISQGAAVSIEYAVRHPERVSSLVLFGGYPAGWRIGATPETIAEREAVMLLTRTGWGQDNPAYRQIFSSTFMPSATHDELDWFNDFQRRTTSPENAVRFLSAFGDIDVRSRLGAVRTPTLVIHSRGDRRIPMATGRGLAAAIPHAEFLTLESDNHLLLGREPASQVFVDAVRRFVDRCAK